MEHFGTFNTYGNNSYINNDPNPIVYHFQEQPNLTMPMTGIDINGHDNNTAMLSHNSPVQSHQDMYSYQPSYAWNPTNDLITHYYNEHWLTLSPPQPAIEASPLNQIPMELREFDMNQFDNNHHFLNPNMEGMLLNPMGMNAAPPTARPIELHPVGGFEPIMLDGPQMSGQPVSHGVRDSNNPIFIDLTDKEFEPIPSNNYPNHTVEYQERDNQNFILIPSDNNANHIVEGQELDNQPQHFYGNQINLCECNCQFCRTHRSMSPDNDNDDSMDHVDEAANNNNDNSVIIIDDDTDDDDHEDVDNNDQDDDNDMNSEPGYEIYVPSVATQGIRVVDTLDEFDRLSYEQILAIQEAIGFVDIGVPHNMLEQALKRKRFFPSASSSSSSSNANCSICWDEFKVGQDTGVLKCGHEFCYDCIEKWLKNKKTCPLCRQSVL